MIGTLVEVVLDATDATALTDSHFPGATTLTVEDTDGFTPTGGTLSLDDAPARAYTTAVAGLITLQTSLTTVALTGATVAPLDARGRQVGERQARVMLDDDERAVTATIPSGLVANFPLGDVLAGSLVEVEVHHGLWRVASQPQQSPGIDSTFFEIPHISALLPRDISWPSGGVVPTVDTWQLDDDADGVTYDATSGIFTFTEPGRWSALFGVTFAPNPDGGRRARILIHYVDGTSEIGPEMLIPANTGGGGTAAQVALPPMRFEVGDGLSFVASQGSGAALSLLGSEGRDRNRLTYVSIDRDSP